MGTTTVEANPSEAGQVDGCGARSVIGALSSIAGRLGDDVGPGPQRAHPRASPPAESRAPRETTCGSREGAAAGQRVRRCSRGSELRRTQDRANRLCQAPGPWWNHRAQATQPAPRTGSTQRSESASDDTGAVAQERLTPHETPGGLGSPEQPTLSVLMLLQAQRARLQ